MLKRRQARLSAIVVGMLAMIMLAGCGGYGPVTTDTYTIEREDAESLRAEIVMAIGDLHVNGDATNLMDGDFRYNQDLEPQIDYDVRDGQGTLRIEQSSSGGGFINWGNVDNEWNVRLSDDLPIDLFVDRSSGDSWLNLQSLTISRLTVDSSSGDAVIDMDGDQSMLSDIEIDISSGDADLSLPGNYPALNALSANTSSGNVDLVLTGHYETLQTLQVDTSSGDVTANLNGEWQSALSGEITVSSGQITLLIPRDVNVRVDAETSSGDVTADGFTIEGDSYVNSPDGASDISLDLQLSTSSGDITLELVD